MADLAGSIRQRTELNVASVAHPRVCRGLLPPHVHAEYRSPSISRVRVAVEGGPRCPRSIRFRPWMPRRLARESSPSTSSTWARSGSGGPAALVGYMRRDLVERRKVVDEATYNLALALAQIMPGPLAAQTAMAIGYFERGLVGATVVGIAFVLPSFLMVIAVSALYVAYGGLPWMQSLFYGIGAVVISIIAIAAYRLARGTNKRDPLLWGIFAALFGATAAAGAELAMVSCSRVCLSCSSERVPGLERHWRLPLGPSVRGRSSGPSSNHCSAQTPLPPARTSYSRSSSSSRKRERSSWAADWPSCRSCNRGSSRNWAGSPTMNP